MNQLEQAPRRIEVYYLPLCLIVQSALLFWRLDLLPVWGDEQFTLDTSAQPLAQIAGLVRGDIQPPLYYLLVHYWLALPWPAALIVKARAFSGLWALAATLLLDRLWGPEKRFFLLWALSPCLILYGRMARSYTLQLLLGCLALYWGMSLVRDPRRRAALLWYALAGSLLLYTHYLPALAILVAVGVFLLYRRAWTAGLVPIILMTLAYMPWLIEMRTAFGRVLRSQPYAVTQHPILEQVIRLLYLPVSFTLGESAPLWAILGGALLAPALLALLWWTLRKPPDWLPLVALAAAIGYVGAGRWVSFAFIPARLLFALPFYLMLLTRRRWICAPLLCLWIGSLHSYFRKDDFLNKGYLIPFDQIGDVIEQRSGGRPARLVVEAPGLDVAPLKARVGKLNAVDAEIIWLLRGRSQPALPYREIWRAGFVPYSKFDRFMMRLLDWPTQPAYVLELVEYKSK